MDVCPVGAITTRDYRFKSRPWDNPQAVDTVCTLCSKGCNTTAWLKAKPEWVKAARLIRFTPRLNPEVNGYWMCDIGRFNYHWIESNDRLRRPLVKDGAGVQQPASWHDTRAKLVDSLTAAGKANPDGVRFLLSAHAAHEELFLFRRLAEELVGNLHAITVSWRTSHKPQPAGSKFIVPEVDAPNVAGARVFGFVNDGDGGSPAGVSTLRSSVEAGQVSALYVFDPGPDESLADPDVIDWIVNARLNGTLPLLIVQGVLLTRLAKAADFVLPGASYVEKEASYTNDGGRLQAAARVLPLPGEAMEDWQILVNLAAGLGVALEYTDAAQVRADIASSFAGVKELDGISALGFGHPIAAKHWLQASNPSERWKWDFMFQDLPPVKGTVEPSALPMPAGAIALREVK
jgi:NADH-quinone oxidoreductase subunit G